MKSKLIPILIVNLFAATAYAQDASSPFRLSGSIGLGAIGTDLNATDKAKAKEYRDLDSGVLGTFDIKGRGGNYWLNAFGENLGRDDQFLELKGGNYGNFKYQLFHDTLVHNWALGAKSPLQGAGGTMLVGPYPVYTPANTFNTNAWSTFDLKDKKTNYGGMFEFSGGTPWFIRVDANEKTDKGLKLVAGANGTSPGNGFSELPSPLGYTTRNFSAEGGYASRAGQLTVNYLQSRFSNKNDTFMWQNQFFGNLMDTTTLAADNVQNKVSVNGVAKQLPFNSTLSGRFTYSNTTNGIPVSSTALTAFSPPAPGVTSFGLAPTNPSTQNFTGKVVHTTGAVSWHFNPTKEFDIRPYWYGFKKDNKSPLVEFTNLQPTTTGTGITCGRVTSGSGATVINPGDCETETLSYRKNNLGIEGGYRFSPANRVIAGYDYLDVKRNRLDINRTTDKKASVEWRNSTFDQFGMRAKYWHMDRDYTFLEGGSGANANFPEYLNRFVRKYDAVGMKQDLIKVVMDYQPAPLWDLGLEGIAKENKYKDTTLGRTKDSRKELYASVAWGDINSFRIMAFADVEYVAYDSQHRNISSVSSGTTGINLPQSGNCQTTFPNCFDPGTATNSTNYNWSGVSKDWNKAIGIGVDWKPMDKFKLSGSLSWAKTNGSADFATPPGLVLTTPTVPINISDNTTKWSLNLKGTYNIDRRWDIMGGYAYEKYTFKDIAYDGYQYMVAGSTGTSPAIVSPVFNATSSSFLSGQGAYPNYKMNTFWVMGKYNFE